VFHSRGWLQALRRTYGNVPAALATRTSSAELRSAIVFCEVKSWLTGRRLVSVPFSDYCDPLVENDDDQGQLIEALHPYRASWKYFELRTRGGLSESGNRFVATDHFVLHRLDLSAGPQDVCRRFHNNHVGRKIRRSECERRVYEEGRSEELLGAFYRLQVQTYGGTRSRHSQSGGSARC
jgi:hypothetical protein